MENPNQQSLLSRTLLSRRTLLLGTVGAGLSALLIACGDDDDDAPDPTATIAPATEPTATTAAAESTATSEPESSASAYPVTIDHKYGSTTIEAFPERVVLVGLTEQDSFIALGVVPVATTEWYGDRPGAIFPWAEELLGGADVPIVLPGGEEIDFEQIQSLQPDVIVGLYSSISDQDYATLSQIAPTVAQPGEYVDYGIPWQVMTQTVGDILGKRDEADALIEEVENRFAATRSAHPEFAGEPAMFVSAWGLPENYWIYSSQDPRGRIITGLGFEVPEVFDELAGDEFGALVSAEQFDLLGDLTALVWVNGPELLEDVALYQALPVVKDGRVIYYGEDNPVYDALNFGTVLSLPFAIENIVPDLVNAIDGDPAT